MAAASATTNAAGRPKRKRQRRRRTNVSSDESSSDSSSSDSSSSDSDSSDDDSVPVKAAPVAAAAVHAAAADETDSSSDDSSSSSGDESDSSSGSDLSFLEDVPADGGRRRGRGRRRAAEQQAAGATPNGTLDATQASAAAAAAAPRRAPYPERSPSPTSKLARMDPREFVPLGTGAFPLLQQRIQAVSSRNLKKGKAPTKRDDGMEEDTAAVVGEEEEGGATRGPQILEGLVEGDAGEQAAEATLAEDTQKRQDRFGDWWRARLVSEFEGDLGKLAAVRLICSAVVCLRAPADLETRCRNPA